MRARLMGWVQQVVIEPIDRAGTAYDGDEGEEYATIERGAQITLLCQLDETDRNARRPGQAGPSVGTRAELTFLFRDVQAASWQPSDGDRVVQIADRDGTNAQAVNWYLRRSAFSGKTSYGREIVVLSATDQSPTRVSSEGLY